MEQSIAKEIKQAKTEMESIITELGTISTKLRNKKSFCGIGTDLCANKVDSVKNDVNAALKILKGIDCN